MSKRPTQKIETETETAVAVQNDVSATTCTPCRCRWPRQPGRSPVVDKDGEVDRVAAAALHTRRRKHLRVRHHGGSVLDRVPVGMHVKISIGGVVLAVQRRDADLRQQHHEDRVQVRHPQFRSRQQRVVQGSKELTLPEKI